MLWRDLNPSYVSAILAVQYLPMKSHWVEHVLSEKPASENHLVLVQHSAFGW